MSLHACTVVTPDHVARARVLARSLREHHPDARLTALVIGDPPAPAEPFEVLGVEALDVPAARGDDRRLRAVRAGLRAQAVAAARTCSSSSPAVLYLDSDIRVYGPLDDACRRAAHGLVLTRHLLGPLPRDGRHPSEEDILVAGVYNGGLPRREPRRRRASCDWWAERLAQECTIDPARGLFARPALARARARPRARTPRCCAIRAATPGFWDLPNRPLTGGPGAYAVAGVPLRCFHFSGFDPDRPDVLSAHQNRVDLAEHPPLARLVCRLRPGAARGGPRGDGGAAARRPHVAGAPALPRGPRRAARCAGR